MTKKEKEANTARIISLAEKNNTSIIEAALKFAEENHIPPERIVSRVTPAMIDRIKAEAREDETLFHIHQHSPKTNNPFGF